MDYERLRPTYITIPSRSMSPKWSSNIRFHVSSLFRFVGMCSLFRNMTLCSWLFGFVRLCSLQVQVCEAMYSVQVRNALKFVQVCDAV